MTAWIAYERVEGSLGPRGAWERMARVASLIANAHRDVKRKPEPFEPRDFLPWVERPRMTEAVFKAMFSSRIVRKKEAKR